MLCEELYYNLLFPKCQITTYQQLELKARQSQAAPNCTGESKSSLTKVNK